MTKETKQQWEMELASVKLTHLSAYVNYHQDGIAKQASFLGDEKGKPVRTATTFGVCSYLELEKEENNVVGGLAIYLGEKKDYVILQAKIQNHTGHDIYLDSMVLMEGEAKYPKGALVTPLLSSKRTFPLEESDFSVNWVDAVGIYPPEGCGFLIGPMGNGVAYGQICIDKEKLQISSKMDGILLEDGESKESEAMVLLCGESNPDVFRWAAECGKNLNARTHRKALDGWCSWYDRTTNITEEHVNNIIEVYKKNREEFRPMLIQIDDGYQCCDGDWSANEKFSSGMKALSKRIKKAGIMPGKWIAPLMISPNLDGIESIRDALQADGCEKDTCYMEPNPFHPLGANWLEPTHPKAKEYLKRIIKQAVDDGYEYIKIDFNGIGSIYSDKKKTTLEVFRELYSLYRREAKEGMYILSCIGSPTRGPVGYCDSARIGPDSHPGGIYDSLEHVLKFQYMHKRWWNNDPDVTYLAPMVEGRCLGELTGKDTLLRTWHSAIGISGGAAMTSEPLQEKDAGKYWRMVEIMTPATQENARLYDLCRNSSIGRFGFTARRGYGDFATVLLWNDEKEKQTRKINRAELQLSCEKIAVYSFWDDQIKGIFDGDYETKTLEPMECEHLRITPLDGKTCIVGSSLHLSIGAEEIRNVVVNYEKIIIELTDAGAREGNIYVYCTHRISKAESLNLKAEIWEEKNSIYKITIKNRKRGQKQTLSLKFEI